MGSQAYGLATPESDTDTLGIYVEPNENLYGLKLYTEKDFSKVTKDPDRTLHEVGKFCRLALQCNPTVTELLWVPESLLIVNSAAGSGLRVNARAFLSADLVRSSYMGYAEAQFKRLLERGDGSFSSDTRKRTKKHARHLLRLMHQGYTLYSTGDLPIRIEDPERYFEFGEIVADHPDHAKQTIQTYRKMFEEVRPAIPEKADRDRVDRIIKWIRKVY